MIEDLSQPVLFFRNQRVAAQQVMFYDSLYQLIEARGAEVDQPSHGPGLPPPYDLPLDPTRLVNYVQRFEYDLAGNVLSRQHSNVAGLRMAVASTSNRALPERPDGSLPDEAQIATAYDGRGNLLQLEGIVDLCWNPRNQLAGVCQVLRESGNDDYERYIYSADGNRVRKRSVAQARSRRLITEVRYLPGLELHRGVTGETRRVVMVDDHLRISDDQWRYSLGDHLGSIALELDGQGALLSRETFYPFGGTAVWAARSAVQSERKRHRFCGKERDASGLYCFGLRYYAPWLARWISADPLGEVDGLNLYRMVLNNPLTLRDGNGGYAIADIPSQIPHQTHYIWAGSAIPLHALHNALMFREENPDWQVNIWTPEPTNFTSTLLRMEDSVEPMEHFLASRHGAAMNVRSPDEMFTDLAWWYPQAHKIRSLYEREGKGAFGNLASLADIGRLSALQAYGGLYMDFDVAVKGAVDLSRSQGDFFMYTEGSRVSNAVLAGLPGSATGAALLDRVVHEYSAQSNKNFGGVDAGWVGKRSTPGDGLLSRYRLTMFMTGPTMIRSVLGNERVQRDETGLPRNTFFSRKPVVASNVLRGHDLASLRYAGYSHGLNGDGNWTAVRPGRRSSIA